MSNETRGGWQQTLTALSGAVAAVLIPVVLAAVGNAYTTAIKEREIESRFVELALNILKDEPTKENENVRKWAVQVVNKYSGVPLSAAAESDLIQNIPIAVDKVGSATSLERQGFQALLDGRYDDATKAFEAAEVAYPTYHSVYEIARELRTERSKLDDPQQRKQVIKHILGTWRVPSEFRDRMKEQTE
jgi:hypothetical protein